MKYLLLITIVLILLSCRKDETTLLLVNNMSTIQQNEFSYPYLDGSMYEIAILEFNKNNRKIGSIYINTIKPNKTSITFRIGKEVAKVKISFKNLPKESEYYNLSSNVVITTENYFLLNIEDNTIISINDSTKTDLKIILK